MTTPVRRGSLASMAVPKAITAPEPETAQAPAESPKGAPSPKSPTPRRAPGDVKTVQARINKQGWKALRDLAADREVSLEALMVDALNDHLLKHKQPPIVQRRTGERGTEGGE
ncbi:hypothetical protein MKK64_01995 [Methylobacterium sp. E-025]|uniref:ribbon-helix-helix domain-containing protein n=1 Tax=Methylobacterium sp. E-025 TaxID=2836561 RepID=UPI001FBA8492|nr:ribbon-helix-helix domain-containing protein [Methylobacterium sp. E-025]MCJ2109995.1 hypothetical protein [Methylobacterium sp. E-025]